MSWKFGDVTVTRVVETELTFPPETVLIGLTADEVTAVDWMQPHFSTEQGDIKLSFHAFLVRTPAKTIIVDTCFGEGRIPPATPTTVQTRTFLENLEAEGVLCEDVDVVLCTHLHLDHVGWNTRNENGTWVPTFPNARYLFAADEYEPLKARAEAGDPHAACFDVSVAPPYAAGLVDLVDARDGFPICDELTLIPTPGHTPGHVSVRIMSGGDEAVITGDLVHTPLQCARPEMFGTYDGDGPMASATRRAFFERVADRDVLILGTHFPAPTAGHIGRDGDAWIFRALPTDGT
jgi:glyoxylase-like metal-dependent hydrolase (beta-lactamase superfamily II)